MTFAGSNPRPANQCGLCGACPAIAIDENLPTWRTKCAIDPLQHFLSAKQPVGRLDGVGGREVLRENLLKSFIRHVRNRHGFSRPVAA